MYIHTYRLLDGQNNASGKAQKDDDRKKAEKRATSSRSEVRTVMHKMKDDAIQEAKEKVCMYICVHVYVCVCECMCVYVYVCLYVCVV